MIEKTCRCGKTKKSFSVDIGPFFIAECCEEAGYNHLGERFEPEQVGLDSDEVKTAIDAAGSLQVVDDVVDTDDVDDVPPTGIAEAAPTSFQAEASSPQFKSEAKSKRNYNRNGNIKIK